jgi:hypothetical protein
MKLNKLVVSAGLVSAVFAGGAYASEMTIFSGPDFRGGQLTLSGELSNFEQSGFNDRSESIVVRSGRWEVCSDANFAGYCTILGPGEYGVLREPLARRISSARPLASTAYYEQPGYYRNGEERVYVEPRSERRYDRIEERSRYGALELYSLPGFRGDTMKFDREATTLDKRITEQGVSSLVVREGVWEICTDVDFRGRCRVFEPGRYPRLGNFDGAPVGSIRRVG